MEAEGMLRLRWVMAMHQVMVQHGRGGDMFSQRRKSEMLLVHEPGEAVACHLEQVL